MAIEQIGVIGAGQMGGGIAQVSALAGWSRFTTSPPSASMPALRRSAPTWPARSPAARSRQRPAKPRWPAFPAAPTCRFFEADLVIEAATDETIKRKIYAQLCPLLKPTAIVATNTSSLSITRLASATDRPERFMGIHFMNPVPIMKLVELVRGIATDDPTFQAARAYVTALEKTITVSEDFPPSSSIASCCR
jgi:3-hydroxybutyryl-CoA dehydrogenase